MSNIKCRFSAILSLVLAFVLVLGMTPAAFAAEPSLEAGSYSIDASLSAFISAMGGVEFGNGLLTGATVNVDENGDASVTIGLATSQVTIYGVTCDTFIDATNSAPGYYQDGTSKTATYTLSDKTALNPNSESIHYVDTITVPVAVGTESVKMWMYVNSTVMGCQFGDGSGSGSSNTPGANTPYTAKLTLDWSSAEKIVEADKTSTQDANVSLVYQASGEYEVSIPATIQVDKSTLAAAYTVEATSFDIDDAAYVTVTAATDGVLTNDKGGTTTFTNTLADGKLKVTGDTLAGAVSVEKPSAHGTFQGSITFTIRYFSGE